MQIIKTFLSVAFMVCLSSVLVAQVLKKDIKRSDTNQETTQPAFFLQPVNTPDYIPESDTVIKHWYRPNPDMQQRLWEAPERTFSFQVFKGKETVEIIFSEKEVVAKNARIRTSTGQTYTRDYTVRTFTGSIKNRPGWATLTVTEKDFYLVVADHTGNYEVGPAERGFYRGAYAVMKPVRFEEPAENEILYENEKPISQGGRYGNCLELFIEVDYQTFTANGSSLPATNLWITRLMTNVQAVYNLHAVPIIVSDILIWSSPDPYAGASNLSVMNQTFVNTRQNNYNGRIAVLLSTRNLGGGLAHGLGGFCNQYPQFPGPFCTNTNLELSNLSFPNYSYNTYLVSHEIGHVLGLRHTHACVWNGNYSQVDDCGNVYAQQNNQTIEGVGCFDEDNPILNPGTIMSHCHLIQGVGINLSQGFGAVVGQRLYQNYTFASCLTGSSCSNIPPPNDICLQATILTPARNCTPAIFSNTNANASGITPGFTCGNPGAAVDVWFRTEVPASGQISIETGQVTGGLTDMLIQVYSGSCGNLVQVACDDNSGAGNHALVNLSGRTPGEILYIRVVESGSDASGTFSICAYDVTLPCHPDFQELINLYNATNGAGWTNKTGWQQGAAGNNCNVCSWHGVTCNDDQRVMEIRLPNNNLSGTLPATLTNLSLLKVLVLYDNNLNGTIPSWLPDFDYLEILDLGGNNYTGTLPAFLAAMPAISSVYLDNNNLSGTLLPALGNMGLSLLYLNDNNFQGCYPTSYVNLCSASVNFINNANLPANGNFALFCADGTGGDADNDGYCKGPADCDDTNPMTYLGADEFCDGFDNDCDGMTDEGVTPVTNTWTGASGNWNVASNWSLGLVPARCMHVIINTNVTVTVPAGITAMAKSVTTSNQANLIVVNEARLETD